MERTAAVPASPEQVYTWLTRAGALQHLLPPWSGARVMEQPPAIADGARVGLALPAGPLTLRWAARYRNTIPGRQFVAEQVSGPFRRWVHLHRMTPEDNGYTQVLDRVEFDLPLGHAGRLAAPLVRRRIGRLLDYRHAVLADEFRQGMPAQPLRVAVTGATGFIGSRLVPALRAAGHSVRRIVRHNPTGDDIVWDPDAGLLDARQLEGTDAVIHLAGASIAGGRWTAERKAVLVRSRTAGTALLARTLARLARRPAVLVSMSAAGYYGDRGDTGLTESSEPGDDFLATTATAWEASADPARDAGIRVVHPRPQLVLSPAGGALPRLALPIRLGAGGRLGTGRQWISWIALDDVLGALRYMIEHDDLHGPVNLVAPEAITNAAFMHALGRVLHRPSRIPAPAFALRLLLGEMADALLLASQHVEPAALARSGYRMRYPELEGALRHVMGQ